jgi:methionine synthase I (cobalamin-dependent)
VEQQKQSSDLFVFGSLGPLVESYRADLIMKHDQGVAYYEIMVKAMLPYVDCFLAETMSSVDEALQAIDAVANIQRTIEPSVKLPCMVSFSLQSTTGRLWSKESPCEAVDRLVDYCDNIAQINLLGILFNCATPEAITLALGSIHSNQSLRDKLQAKNIRLGAYANRLTPVPPNWSLKDNSSSAPQPFRTDLDPDQYYEHFVKHWVEDLNAGIVGGCCGITPEHMQLLYDKLRPNT